MGCSTLEDVGFSIEILLESQRRWLGCATPESVGFAMEILFKIRANLLRVGHARICWIRNLSKSGWGVARQNLLDFQLKYN